MIFFVYAKGFSILNMVRLRSGRHTNIVLPKECAICFNALNERNCLLLECDHAFCPCLLVWLGRKLSCPLCREPVEDMQLRLDKPLRMDRYARRAQKRRTSKMIGAFITILASSHLSRVSKTLEFPMHLLLVLSCSYLAQLLNS